jgi:ABC-2 type transport system permease protein
MRTAWIISLKDLRSRLRDRSALIVGIVVPLALAAIFNAVFSGAAGGNAAIKLAVADGDHGAVARVLVDNVLGEVSKSGFIVVRDLPSLAVAHAEVSSGSVAAVIVVPAGFTVAVQANQPAALQVIGNADDPISTEVARSIADGYTADLNRVRLSVATASSLRPGSDITRLVAAATAAAPPVQVVDQSTATKELNPKSFYAAGMAVFFVFFTVQFGVTGLLEERANGTLARLLAAPIRRFSVLAGKMLTSLVLGVVSMTVLVVATTVLFGASWGNPLGVAVLVLAAVIAAMGVMALIATAARTAEQASNWQSVVAVILGLLGGTFFPVARAPGVLSTLTLLTPQAWFLRGLGDLRAGQLGAVWTPALAMLAFAVVTGGIAMARLAKVAEV